MSTKATIAYGPEFHIYEDVTDMEREDGYPVYVELDFVPMHAELDDGRPFIVLTRTQWEQLRKGILASCKE